MADDLLDLALYSYAEVDRYVGLSAGTAHRWLAGYELRGRRYQPVLRAQATDAATVTWGELVEVCLLAEFRRSVPVRRLRRAVALLRDEFGPYPLVRARPDLRIEGRELVRIVQDHDGFDRPLESIVVRNGQHALAEPADRIRSAIEYEDGIAVRLRPAAGTPSVVIDPRRESGQPRIRGVRTAVLAEEARAGASRQELADRYGLTVAEVEEGLLFESSFGRRELGTEQVAGGPVA